MVLTPKQKAEAKGYTVDTCVSGSWYAYVGPRFAPTSWFEIPTDREWHLYRLVERSNAIINVPTSTLENRAVIEIKEMLDNLEKMPCLPPSILSTKKQPAASDGSSPTDKK